MGIKHFFDYENKKKLGCWDYEKNKLKPKDVSLCSNTKFWFNCDKCPHRFESRLHSVTKGRWCSYCSNQKLCDKEDCKNCFDKSFASFDKLIFWDYEKNDIFPRNVFKSSHKKFWFYSHLYTSFMCN